MDRWFRYVLTAAAACVLVASIAYVTVGWYRMLGVGHQVAAIAENQQRIIATINQLHVKPSE